MSKRLEHCSVCDEPTGRAGIADDSIYWEGIGPLCEACNDQLLHEEILAEAAESGGDDDG